MKHVDLLLMRTFAGDELSTIELMLQDPLPDAEWQYWTGQRDAYRDMIKDIDRRIAEREIAATSLAGVN